MSESRAYMERLGKELGMEIELSQTGAAAFEIDGKVLLLQWNEAERSFVVYAELGYLDGYNDAEVLQNLLSANFLLMESKGGVLSYDRNKNMVGYNYVLQVYGLSPEEFIQRLNAVILLAQEWNGYFEEMKKEQKKIIEERIKAAEDQDEAVQNSEMANMQFIRI